MIEYIKSHIEWSKKALGPGANVEGLLKHIAEELEEIRANPVDVYEWVDVIILAIDGAWRAGYSAEEIVVALITKQRINTERKWTVIDEDTPIEHVKC